MGAQVFSREGVEKDQRSLEIEEQAVARINRDRNENIRTVRESAYRQLVRLLADRKAGAKVADDASGDALIKKGEAFTAENLRTLPFEQYERITIEDGEDLEEKVWNLVDKVREKEDQIRSATPPRSSATRRATSSALASSSS